MKKLTYKWLSALSVAVMGAMLVTGCGGPTEDDAGDAGAESQGTVKLAYVNWAEGVAVTHLMDVLLTDMGYTVETTMADVAPIYTSVAEGDQDIMVETWLPHTHESYYEQYGDQVELISTWFDSARIGLVVPSYVTIDSISEMNDASEQFNGVITGIDAGAGIMGATESAIEDYELDYELLASSGPAMTAALQGAIQNEEWIVVTGWAPHWKFARYDLKFLDDPKGNFGATERIHSAARLGFSEEYPEVTALFQNLTFDGSQIGSLMDALDGAEGAEERAVREWISENEALVASWMP